MNTANIKKYAPKARTAFIAAMTRQAAKYGITLKGAEPLEIKGDLALIGDRPFPASIANARAALARKVAQQGFTQAMEQAAYSWFNRLCALRYMEIHDYLDHGRRVLSAADGSAGVPQILDECLELDLPGLDKQRIAELKLDGTRDEELYRELLLTQCHALHKAMPFLFEEVDDATELLLPDNLTRTDSLIRELVTAIPETDWQEIEVIGWLYQFYISEKKDQVIGKVVKSEDIPAATQLFTPNWIVQYLVQNSLGRQWLQTYPDSPLKDKMPYYVATGEQPAEVQAQLAASTPESIDPLTLKVLDPACGSGHILVEAYQLLKEIYTERGFRSRDIPQLILENNLFGLDIDDRAGQLAGFALMMLACEDDRRIFSRELKLNVLALQESRHLDLDALWGALNLTSDWQRGQSQGLFDSEQSNLAAAQADNRYQLLRATLARFTQAKTFGSLIDVPAEDAQPLGELLEQLRQLAGEGDSMQKPAAQTLLPYVQQAWILAQRYDAVIANPPYMGSSGMCALMKDFAKEYFPDSKDNLFACFIECGYTLTKDFGHSAMVTLQNWMFLSSFERMRKRMLEERTICTMAHIGYNSFPSLNSKVALATAFSLRVNRINGYIGSFVNLDDAPRAADKEKVFLSHDPVNLFEFQAEEFSRIPGAPIAYWASPAMIHILEEAEQLSTCAEVRKGLATCDDTRWVRYWFELDRCRLELRCASNEDARVSTRKWFPLLKGGPFRKWFGNCHHVVDWADGGSALKSSISDRYGGAHYSKEIRSEEFYFQECMTWSDIATPNTFGARYCGTGFISSTVGGGVYSSPETLTILNALLCSSMANIWLRIINPTLHANPGDIAAIPLPRFERVLDVKHQIGQNSLKCRQLSADDWNAYESSWDFNSLPLVAVTSMSRPTLKSSYANWITKSRNTVVEMRRIEEENNRLFIEAYGLASELTPDVPLEQITLTCNPYYRYGGDKSEAELETLLQCDTLKELVSYAIGCMMGRYSLDKPGLILASQGETVQDYLRRIPAPRFMPDNDAILPLTDQEWFADDATNRFREFVRVVWGDETLQENLAFVADSLCLHAIKPKRGESAIDTIRRYLSTQFYKDHLRTYKKRPIYWLFSSGKHKAFECLVYLHRYNEGTLARMRTEYVIPLTAKLNSYAAKLEKDKEASHSAAEIKRIEKELDTLHKQQAELATFDEKLRHYADQRISLDLDDGVKANYGKFGDLLAEVKAVTGDKGE